MDWCCITLGHRNNQTIRLTLRTRFSWGLPLYFAPLLQDVIQPASDGRLFPQIELPGSHGKVAMGELFQKCRELADGRRVY